MIPWTDLVYAAAPNGQVSVDRDHAAGGGDEPGRGREGDGRQRDLRRRPVRDRARASRVGEPFVPGRPMGYLAPAGTRPRGRRRRLGRADERRRALRPTPQAQAIVELLDPLPLGLLRHPGAPAAAAADRLRLHRRPLPGRRGDALREPHREALSRGCRCSLLLGDFGHQRASNDPHERERLLRAIHALVRPSPARRGPRRRAPASIAFVQRCPRERRSLRPVPGRELRASSPAARSAARRARAADGHLRAGGDPEVGAGDRPGDRRRRLRASASTLGARRESRPRRGWSTPGAAAITLIGAPRARGHGSTISGAGPGDLADRRAALGRRPRRRAPAARRPRHLPAPAQGRNLWQLHPGAWRFERGPHGRARAARPTPPTRGPRTAASRSASASWRCGCRCAVERRRGARSLRRPAPRADARIPAGLRAAPAP